MSEGFTVVINLSSIFGRMNEALETVVKDNPGMSFASVRERIGEDAVRIAQIAQSNGGTAKEMHQTAWNLAVSSMLYFFMVQSAIAQFNQTVPTPNGSIH